MSRSGYSDDCDDDYPVQLYRGAVRQAIRGRRGQSLLLKLRDALDAMSVKRLIANEIQDESGDVCALGALDRNAPRATKDEYGEFDDYDGEQADKLAKHFGISHALAAEIVYMNDEFQNWRTPEETPEARWIRMRKWPGCE